MIWIFLLDRVLRASVACQGLTLDSSPREGFLACGGSSEGDSCYLEAARIGWYQMSQITVERLFTARFTVVGLVGDSQHARSKLGRLVRSAPKALRPMRLLRHPSYGLRLGAGYL